MASNQAHDQYFDFVFKVLLVGESGVGKTAISLRYVNNVYELHTVASTGIDFRNKIIEVEGRRAKIQIWDTAGQERFHSITTNFFRSAQGIVVFYDVTNQASFEKISFWMDCIKLNAPKSVKVMLCGNKCDMGDRRKVNTRSGQSIAKEYGVPFYETSAGTGLNVDEVFDAIVKQIFMNIESPKKDTIRLGEYDQLTDHDFQYFKCCPKQ